MKYIKVISGALLVILALTNLIACGNVDENTNSVSIEFVSASPRSITLQGTGGSGLSETSNIQFKVKDSLGVILEGQTVEFNLSTRVGGITLNPSTAISDENGLINTIVQSGSVPTAVRVIAGIPGTDITTQSDQLAISAGIPDQDSSSLSAEILNPESYGIDGVTVIITMRLGDIFNNIVPQGTSISFTAEGGVIEGNCVTDETSGCSVNWTSQNPRPEGGDGTGLVTIMATALGQESFTDNNGNGIFDSGDTFEDIGEAFRNDNNNRDINGNDIYDQGEFFEDLNGDGVYTGPDGRYNGSSCQPGFTLCSTQKNVHVRHSLRLAMSTSDGQIILNPAGTIDASAGPVTVTVTIQDNNGNSMPGGSGISVETDNGTIQNAVAIPVIIPVNRIESYSFDIVIVSDGDSSTGGLMTISVNTPSQGGVTFLVDVND